MDIFNKKIILASQSPRRKQLLEQVGFQFEIKIPDVVEDYPADLKKENVAEFLAIKKANAAKNFITNDEIILAADSIVLLDNAIYGKPKDEEDAFEIISKLSGNIHQVITGVCLMSKEKAVSFSGISKVHFLELSDEEIRFYIQKYQPFDKAGAYAIQEWIGLCKIAKIEGTYSNIMGLPVDLVYQHLLDW